MTRGLQTAILNILIRDKPIQNISIFKTAPGQQEKYRSGKCTQNGLQISKQVDLFAIITNFGPINT